MRATVASGTAASRRCSRAWRTTRAIRRYTADPIPDADLATILWHAGRAPSGSNRQPFRFLVLRDGPKAMPAKALLGESFRAAWADKIARDGYTVGSGADPSSPKSRMAATMQHYVDHVEQVPVIVLVCLVRYRRPDPSEGASVFPACQNLLLAARALGYGGALTGMHSAVETGAARAARRARRRGHVGVHHARPAGWPPRPGAPQAAGRGGVRRRVGRVAGVGRRPAWHPPHQVDAPSTPASAPSRLSSVAGVASDPFEVLGLTRQATIEEVRAARRVLAMQLHPDKGGDIVKMQEVNVAFEAAVAHLTGRRTLPDLPAPPGPPASRRRGRVIIQHVPPPQRRGKVHTERTYVGNRVQHDTPSFTIDALPVEAFEALLVVASWIGEVRQRRSAVRAGGGARPNRRRAGAASTWSPTPVHRRSASPSCSTS